MEEMSPTRIDQGPSAPLVNCTSSTNFYLYVAWQATDVTYCNSQLFFLYKENHCSHPHCSCIGRGGGVGPPRRVASVGEALVPEV